MSPRTVLTWLPLLILPTVAMLFAPHAWPRCAFMWLLASAGERRVGPWLGRHDRRRLHPVLRAISCVAPRLASIRRHREAADGLAGPVHERERFLGLTLEHGLPRFDLSLSVPSAGPAL